MVTPTILSSFKKKEIFDYSNNQKTNSNQFYMQMMDDTESKNYQNQTA